MNPIDRWRGARPSAVLYACLLFLAPSAGLAAQDRVDISPFAGIYVPLANVIDEPGGSVKQQIGPVFGARGVYWIAANFGIEGAAALGFANVEGESGTTSETASSTTLLASARGRWRSGDAGAVWPLLLSGGLAIISHGGDAFEPLTGGTTDIGLVFGAGTEHVIGDRLRLRIDIEDHVYSGKFTFGGEESDAKLQNDIMLSFGLSLTVSRPLARDRGDGASR